MDPAIHATGSRLTPLRRLAGAALLAAGALLVGTTSVSSAKDPDPQPLEGGEEFQEEQIDYLPDNVGGKGRDVIPEGVIEAGKGPKKGPPQQQPAAPPPGVEAVKLPSEEEALMQLLSPSAAEPPKQGEAPTVPGAVPAPAPQAAGTPEVPAEEGMTLDKFVAELNAKLGPYSDGRLVNARCARVKVKPLTPGLQVEFDLWLTGPNRCMPLPPETQADPPPSEETAGRIKKETQELAWALEDVCRAWATFAFGTALQLPTHGEVRLVETENRYFRIHWTREPAGPDPQPTDTRRNPAKKRKAPGGTDVYLLLKSDFTELKRIERAPGKEFKLLEHYQLGKSRGLRLLAKYRHVRPEYDSEAEIEHARAGRVQLPSFARITWRPLGDPAPPVRHYEARFDACSVLEKK
ncbi:MAG: hypothetical protein IT285_05415 [Bdellovibrionales bacterium]|nr:hypothetical protein [Bdellovibrionales bacterium]